MSFIPEGFDINTVQAIRQTGRCQCYFGVGAIDKIDDIAAGYKAKGMDKWLVMTSASAYIKCGAWEKCLEAFAKHEIEHVLYDGCRANPENLQVTEAAELGRTIGAQVVLGIGGGSPLDAAKCVALVLGDGTTDANSYVDAPLSHPADKCLPIVVINTTHGTGTEVDRFAVISDVSRVKKPVLAYNAIYPEFSIDDPALMLTLSADQTLWTSLDALNHVNEAATTVITHAYTIQLCKLVVDLIAQWLPVVLAEPQNIEARYWILYASMVAGIAFDNTLLHHTHAHEHPLAALKPGLAHGLGLSMILPNVDKLIYPHVGKTLAWLWEPILPGFTGAPEEAFRFGKAVEDWLKSVGITTKLADHGFTEEDIPVLVGSLEGDESLSCLRSIAPGFPAGDEAAIRELSENLYREAMTWLPEEE